MHKSMIVLTSVLAVAFAMPNAEPPTSAPAGNEAVRGGLVTLYQLDPISRTVSFATGEPGGVFQDNTVKNRQSDLDFGHYRSGHFTVGIEGGRVGSIRDLGSTHELVTRYGFKETVGGGQGFASLRVIDDQLMVLADYSEQTLVTMGALGSLLPLDGEHEHARVQADHIYVVRLADRHDPQLERLVKFLVVDHRPGVAVTLRWLSLERVSSS